MKVSWAPLNVPLGRRLETLAVTIQMCLLLFGELFSWLLIVFLLIKGSIWIQIICLGYLAFIYYDRKTPDEGGRGAGSQWVRSWIIWKYYINYFPIELIKTADLPPDRNYLFALFPHGILSSGGFGNFNTNYSKWKQLFPGIRSKLLTLNMHFNVPIFRELILSWGMATASAQSLKTILSVSNDPSDPYNRDGYTANGAMIVIGGAQEAFYSRPNNYTIILKRRKGFVKIALGTGASLVPVLSFGEVDLFNQASNPPGSLLRRYQDFFKKITGIAPIFFNGRGMFQYSYGFIPLRRKVTTVIGRPIEVKRNSNPSQDEIDSLHQRFCDELNELFEMHKKQYIENSETIHLIME